MEDDVCDDALIAEFVTEFVARNEAAAIDTLYGKAEIAGGIGDTLSAETWLDLARAVEAALVARSRDRSS